jgi:hypothetical protein
MSKKVQLDSKKLIYDGTSFIVVYTEEELKNKFDNLKRSIEEDLEY